MLDLVICSIHHTHYVDVHQHDPAVPLCLHQQPVKRASDQVWRNFICFVFWFKRVWLGWVVNMTTHCLIFVQALIAFVKIVILFRLIWRKQEATEADTLTTTDDV